MLRATPYLPTNIFKRLRLVVSWETDIANMVAESNATVKTQPGVLCYDEVVNPSTKATMLSGFKGVTWSAIEHDRVVLSATTVPTAALPNTQQETTFTINGFNNKTLNRLLIVNTPTSTSTIQSPGGVVHFAGGLGSKSQYAQEVQLRVNGSNLLAKNGITRPSQRLAMVCDTWGDVNTYTGLSDIGLGTEGANHISNYTTGGAQELDYTGVIVGERVNDLQLDYKRSGVFSGDPAVNARYNQQLFLNLFGEVPKSIVTDGPSYNVVYI